MKHFMKPLESYRRDYDLIGTYIQDTATYLARRTGQPMERCVEFVKESIHPNTGRRPLHIPDALLLQRNKYGDRERTAMPFTTFLRDIQEKGEILSPSLASYVHPSKKRSLLAQYIEGNLKKRSTAKKEMFTAEMKGDMVLRAIKNATQTTMKIKNNSLSGAQCSPFTVLWNKSAHSTLTSTCRTATSYGNANNEKFLVGNRHYWSPDIVKSNIISIINHSDYPAIEAAMRNHNLACPSVEQTMACINRSTEPYWRSERHTAEIRLLVESLSDIERAAFVFTSDLYHLAQVNPMFVRRFFAEMSIKPNECLSMEDAKHWTSQMDDNLRAFISMLCAKELAGQTLRDAESRPDDYGVVGAATRQVIKTLDRYQDLIKAFWVTDNLPASIYYLPSIMRRTAITSDTDSTIFTVQYWTEWYCGQLDFSETSLAVANTAVYLTGQLIRHILARFSANMGVSPDQITRLSMKNEFYFPVFGLTPRAKHYFANVSAQEGNVFDQMKMEIKGVALRNSNVPPALTDASHALMRYMMDSIMAGRKISLMQVLRYVALKEKAIHDSVFAGEFEYLKSMQIKSKDSYKDTAKSSNYDHYTLWQEVFAAKYGTAEEPPYRAIKIPLDTNSPTKMREWLASIEDRAIADKLEAWLNRSGRKAMTQLLLPESMVGVHGIPAEIVPVVDIRGTITQVMEGFYILLECLGYFMRNDHNTRLVSDDAWLLAEDWPHGELELS